MVEIYTIVVRVFRNWFDGDKVSHVEEVRVNKEQLERWLKRGDDEHRHIITYRKGL